MRIDLHHRLIFLRHGETDWNAQGRLQGQQDIDLNATGLEQSARAALKIKKLLHRLQLNDKHLHFVASPLSRTRKTMHIVRTHLGLREQDYHTDPRLKELSFGQWEGLTWPEVQQQAPIEAQARENDKWGFVPPMGESYAMLAERVRPWLESLNQDTCVVAHGGIARVFLVLLADMPIERAPLVQIWQDRPILFAQGGFNWI